MFITRECDYAVRVVRALAGAQKLSVSEICEKEDITAPFAYKILRKLQEAGIVKGYRGIHGGYSLEASPDSLTLLKIYQAIDPDLFIIECMDPNKKCTRDGANGVPCQVHQELGRIQKEFLLMLSSRSLGEILSES